MADDKKEPVEHVPVAKKSETYVLNRKMDVSNNFEPLEAGTEMGKVECHGLVSPSWLADAIRHGHVIRKEDYDLRKAQLERRKTKKIATSK